MRQIQVTNKYCKDLKLCHRRGNKIAKLVTVIDELQQTGILPAKNRPHKLSGNRAGQWECHIEPDWLLVYSIDQETLTLIETGTHSDLFE